MMLAALIRLTMSSGYKVLEHDTLNKQFILRTQIANTNFQV